MTTPMTSEDVLNEFRAVGALREGHFMLSSGLHSPVFLQKNLVFMDSFMVATVKSDGILLVSDISVVPLKDAINAGLVTQ